MASPAESRAAVGALPAETRIGVVGCEDGTLSLEGRPWIAVVKKEGEGMLLICLGCASKGSGKPFTEIVACKNLAEGVRLDTSIRSHGKESDQTIDMKYPMTQSHTKFLNSHYSGGDCVSIEAEQYFREQRKDLLSGKHPHFQLLKLEGNSPSAVKMEPTPGAANCSSSGETTTPPVADAIPDWLTRQKHECDVHQQMINLEGKNLTSSSSHSADPTAFSQEVQEEALFLHAVRKCLQRELTDDDLFRLRWGTALSHHQELAEGASGKYLEILIGPTGAGKSTLVNKLMGVPLTLCPNAGRLYVATSSKSAGVTPAKIGHARRESETHDATVHSSPDFCDGQLALVDSCGTNDKRGELWQARGELSLEKILHTGRGINGVTLVIQAEHIGTQRGGDIENMLYAATNRFSAEAISRIMITVQGDSPTDADKIRYIGELRASCAEQKGEDRMIEAGRGRTQAQKALKRNQLLVWKIVERILETKEIYFSDRAGVGALQKKIQQEAFLDEAEKLAYMVDCLASPSVVPVDELRNNHEQAKKRKERQEQLLSEWRGLQFVEPASTPTMSASTPSMAASTPDVLEEQRVLEVLEQQRVELKEKLLTLTHESEKAQQELKNLEKEKKSKDSDKTCVDGPLKRIVKYRKDGNVYRTGLELIDVENTWNELRAQHADLDVGMTDIDRIRDRFGVGNTTKSRPNLLGKVADYRGDVVRHVELDGIEAFLADGLDRAARHVLDESEVLADKEEISGIRVIKNHVDIIDLQVADERDSCVMSICEKHTADIGRLPEFTIQKRMASRELHAEKIRDLEQHLLPSARKRRAETKQLVAETEEAIEFNQELQHAHRQGKESLKQNVEKQRGICDWYQRTIEREEKTMNTREDEREAQQIVKLRLENLRTMLTDWANSKVSLDLPPSPHLDGYCTINQPED